MVDYWLLANLASFALLLAVVFIWVKSLLTLVNAYVAQVCYYQVSPHTDTNIRAGEQAAMLVGYFIHTRDKMIFRVMFSTAGLLVIIFARYVMGVVHAAV